MKFCVSVRAFALVSSLALAGCGGGGGGGGTTAGGSTAAPQAVTITEANAKPVAASALDAAQNTSAGQLPVGVEVQAGGQAPNYFSTVARAIQLASSSGPGALATGVTTTQACPMGGSFTMTGDSATRTLNFLDCKLSEGDGAVTMSGSLSVTLISGSTDTMPFHAVVSVVATNFSMASSDGLAVSLSGDMRMDMTVSSTSQTLVVSGSSLSTRFTEGASIYTSTLKNYSQTISFNGFVVTSSLSATVESTSTRLGASGGAYTITTLTPMVQDYSMDVFTAGVVKVVGAGGSQLVMTVGSNNTVTIQVDANGDGTFEKTISSTMSELEALL